MENKKISFQEDAKEFLKNNKATPEIANSIMQTACAADRLLDPEYVKNQMLKAKELLIKEALIQWG